MKCTYSTLWKLICGGGKKIISATKSNNWYSKVCYGQWLRGELGLTCRIGSGGKTWGTSPSTQNLAQWMKHSIIIIIAAYRWPDPASPECDITLWQVALLSCMDIYAAATSVLHSRWFALSGGIKASVTSENSVSPHDKNDRFLNSKSVLTWEIPKETMPVWHLHKQACRY